MSGHSHGATDLDDRPRLIAVLAITATVLVVEVIGAIVSGSLALLADAGHMLTDTAGLVLALAAASWSRRPATATRTWGYRRAEILAAALQALILLGVGGFVLIEGIRRLIDPAPVASTAMLIFGCVGLAANLASLAVLFSRRTGNLNMRGAFLEVANDALGSVAVVVAAVVIALTGWLRADAVVSILIGSLIVPRTVRLLRESVEVLLEGTPRGLNLDDVRAHLLSVEHVHDVHDVHASLVATGMPVLTAHVVVDDSCFHDGGAPRVLDALQACVAEHFPISVEHSTFQLETIAHADHEASHHP